jgi:predicted porin
MADKFVKRSALALAALGLAMGAHAQSSVTLYGTVDAGLVYTNNQQTTLADGSTNGHANYQLAGGNLVPSRWGLMGTEDIGGGTTVNFTLENSFLIGNGAMLQSNTLFNRNAWVGLNNSSYGAGPLAVNTTRSPISSAHMCRATTGRHCTVRISATSIT